MSSQKVSIMLLILAFTLTLYNTGIILKRRKIKKDKDKDELRELFTLQEEAIQKNIDIDLPSTPLQKRKYLNKLETNGQAYDNIDPNDVRMEKWFEQQAIYGFDEREVWNLNQTMIELLYERVRYYLDHTNRKLEKEIIIELSLLKPTKKTLKGWLEYITILCKYIIIEPGHNKYVKLQYTNAVWLIWFHIAKYVED